jgi:hypothetical protein
VSWASLWQPLLAIGWPQQVWSSGKVDLAAEALEQLERGDADLRKEGVDVARHEQGHLHANDTCVGSSRSRRRHEWRSNVRHRRSALLSHVKSRRRSPHGIPGMAGAQPQRASG